MNDSLLRGAAHSVLDRLVAASLRNRVLTLLAVVLLVAVGLRAATQLPIDAVPDVTNVQVLVLTDSPGLGPLEVERFITTPVEQAMGGLPHLAEVRSVSRFGLSSVTVVFDEGTDIYWARQLVTERLGEARSAIPEGYGEPELGPISSGLGEIFQFEVRGEGKSLMELRDLLEWQIAPRLRRVPGVVEVNTFGGELRTYEVEVRPEALAAHDLVLADLFDALERNNVNSGGGYFEKDREQVLIRGVSLLEGLDDVKSVVVKTGEDGIPVHVGDLGDVRFAPMLRQGAVTRDGRGEGVIGIALMLLGENSRVVSQALRTEVDEIQPTLPSGVTIDVFYDRTELVDRTIHTVGKNLLEGAALVVLVLLLTLGNARAAAVAAVVIPLSMLFAFVGMVLFGVSGNLMSLGAIDFGLMVDGAVVILEAVIHESARATRAGRSFALPDLLGAVRRVARPVAFAVGIITLVYLPILSLHGIEGKMFRPMAATVVFALLGSLLLALTAVPVLASLLLRHGDERETWLVRLASRGYEPWLDRALRWPRLTMGAAAALFVVSLGVVPLLGAVFVPTLEEGAIAINILRPPSVSLEESIHQGTLAEQALLGRFPDEVATVVTKTGKPEIATDPMGPELSDEFVMLKPKAGWTKASDKNELVEEMQQVLLSSVPGANFAFSQPIEMRVNELIEGVRADVAVVLYGDDLAELARLGDRVAGALRHVDGAEDVKVEQVGGLPMLRLQVKPAAIGRLGLSAADVMDVVSTIGGRPAGMVFEGRRRYQLQVRFPEDLRSQADRLERLLVGSESGVRVPLGQVTDVVTEEVPLQVSHDDGQRRLTVEANVRGRDVASFVAEAQARIGGEVSMPSGYRMEWGGSFQNLQEASARLGLLVPLVLVLVFVLLHASFGSVRLAALVYANIPLAASGGLIALLLRGLPFSISAGVGFITLSGIAVLNGIVVVSHLRALGEDGLSRAEAARRGALERLRTVLMTTLVAALGFLPMALAHSAGAEVQRPLATVVIGGLFTSTLLTLFVVPVLYAAFAPGESSADPGAS